MGKIQIIFLVFGFICCWQFCAGQSLLSHEQPVLEKVTKQRIKLVELAKSQIGVKELTGNNDGKEVEKYLKSVGLGKGYAWCAAFMAWLHIELGIPNPESAWSPDWFKTNIVFSKFDKFQKDFVARLGQVFGLYYENKGRVAHVGMITWIFPNHYETVEGNTSLIGAILDFMNLTEKDKENERNGQWVAGKTRNKRDIAIISDFVGRQEILCGWRHKKE